MPDLAENPLDRHWMQYALRLAEQSIALCSPNPAVGCVVAQGGQIVGEGFHAYNLLDHAEIVALKQAGEKARGATAYITLEPCSHTGRTGPCADALLSAGIRRVVVATCDPNSRVNGDGIRKLSAAGVEVEIGLFESQARRLNDGFAKYIQTSLPLVVLKIAASLDGRIAPAERAGCHPFWITGEAARVEVQKMRHAADAVLAGVGTILADNPLLTDRSHLPRRRPLLRVVLDSHLRLPLDSQLVATAENDVLVFFTHGSTEAQQALEMRGIRAERLEEGLQGRGVSLRQAIKRLGEGEITSLLVEGGSQVNAAMLDEDLVDRLVVFYAPLFLGGNAVPMLGFPPARLPMKNIFLKRFGEDFALDAYLHDPWAANPETTS